MADCPYCDEWHYDPFAACIYVRVVGDSLPVIRRDGQLRRALGTEAPDGRSEATAAHICREHPLEPDALILGPVEEYAPLRGVNAVLTAMSDAGIWGLTRKQRSALREQLAD